VKDTDRINEIISFAISREREAVEFYQDLQKMAYFSEKNKLLHGFEHMEMGHIEILEEIRKKDIKDIRIYDVQNLHISDYLIKPAPIKNPPLRFFIYRFFYNISKYREIFPYICFNRILKRYITDQDRSFDSTNKSEYFIV